MPGQLGFQQCFNGDPQRLSQFGKSFGVRFAFQLILLDIPDRSPMEIGCDRKCLLGVSVESPVMANIRGKDFVCHI